MSLTQDRLKEVLDYDPFSGVFTWKALKRNRHLEGTAAGHTDRLRGYTRISVDGHLHLAHRLAFLYMEGALPPLHVDHINGDRSDNRWENLRHCTVSENLKNSAAKSRNTSGYKGVTFDKRKGKFKAEIQSDSKRHWLGYFETAKEAGLAYDRAALVYHLEFAKLNGVSLNNE